jgi:arylsulfatase A-like enzyme
MGTTAGFTGTIGRYRDESEPAWPKVPVAPDGAPNVLLVLLDDVGFAQLGCFGSSIPTPNLDRLASSGIRYTNFHTTALCSPTRACLLTGRNHHSVGMGRIIDLATGFPGYDAHIPDTAAMAPAILTDAGYAAYAVGKWHLTPEHELSTGSSRARWPLGKGFERFYGFMDGETNQFAPTLVHDNHYVTQPGSFDDGYHFTTDMVDHAIDYVTDLRNAEPDKPFLLYVTPGACHSPHQAPVEWLERFRGAFDHGWDVERERIHTRQVAEGILPEHTVLSPRPDWVPAWDELSDDQHRIYARYMEAFAAYLAHTDAELGRLLDFLASTGDLDNTITVAMSDNGASSEGGPNGSVNDIRPWNITGTEEAEQLARIDDIGGPWVHNNYPWGWTVAGNTPFRRWKRQTHEGGVADPMIISWPAGIDAAQLGSTRRQYTHVIDVLPTVLELAGLRAPEVLRGILQQPIEGLSFAESLNDPDAPEHHLTQYYEMFGCRALYHDGYKAVTFHEIFDPDLDWEADDWELYDVVADPSECNDLAASEPGLLRQMIERWWVEAARHQVLPLDNAPFDLVFGEGARPGKEDRTRWVYRPAGSPVPESLAAMVRNRSHSISARVDLPGGAATEGVVAAQGSGFGGWTLYARDGQLRYVHNFVARDSHEVSVPLPEASGEHSFEFRFERTGDNAGVGHLRVDDGEPATVEIPDFTPVRWAITGEGLCCGRQLGLPVTPDYHGPFPFTGTIHEVVIEAEGEASLDVDAEADIAFRAQ